MEKYNYECLGKILEAMHPSITIADHNGVFVYVGTSCVEFFGMEPKQLLGKKADNPEIADIFRPCVTDMVYKKRAKVVTIQKNHNGKEALVTGIPIFSELGELEIILGYSSWEVTSYEDLKNSYNRLKQENEALVNQLTRLSRDDYMNANLVSKSKKFLHAERLLKIFADARLPAFIYGPNGSGKKYLAKVAYGNMDILYDYNCNLLSVEVIERDLFGEQGLLTAANGKTVMIHNIECMTPELQTKMILYLKQREIVVIGISEYSLEQLKAERRITEDFYFFFKSYQVQIHALSERVEDLNSFINYYLDFYNMKYGRNVKLAPKAMNTLFNYEWPENVNEIKYTMERIVLTSEKEKVEIHHLPKHISCQSIEVFTDNASLRDMMEFYEKGIIMRTYEKYKTTISVAEKLGISQASAARKIKKYVHSVQED